MPMYLLLQEPRYIQRAFSFKRRKMEKYYILDIDRHNSILSDDYKKGIAFADENFSSEQIIEKLYEPLRLANSDRITREHIGKDSSGEFDMWAYIFTPESYKKTVYIQAGVHGRDEIQGYMALFRMLELMYGEKCTDETLLFIRENVRFLVVPVVNVYDVTKRARGEKCFSPFIKDKVNLNRSWYKGTRVREILNIQAFIRKYKDNIDFGIDAHTDPGGGTGGYHFQYPEGMDDGLVKNFLELLDFLYKKHGLKVKVGYRGDDKNYPLNSSSDVNLEPDYPRQDLSASCSSGLFYDFGIPAVTSEHGDTHHSPTRGDALDMTRSVELIINFVLIYLSQQR